MAYKDWQELSDLEQERYGHTFPDCALCTSNYKGFCERADRLIETMQTGFCGDFRLRKEAEND